MRERKSVTNIFLGGFLILGLLIIPSCLASANSYEQSSVRSASNAVVLNNDAINALANLPGTEQQPQFCSSPNIPIPDMGLGKLSNPISVPDTGTLIDLDVYLNIIHPYVGDLVITLNHVGGPGPITLIDRLGCGGSNIDVTVNDEGTDGNIVSQCADAPAIFGNRVGGKPAGAVLRTFDGYDYNGDWVLTISDNSRGDLGNLVQWCLIPVVTQVPKTGTIEIIEDTVLDGPQDFTFNTAGELSPSTFNLDDDVVDGSLPNIQIYNDITIGTYTVSEVAVSGYSISTSCVDPSGGTTTAGNNAVIELAAGETVICTFTNTEQPPEPGAIIVDASSTTISLSTPGTVPYSYLVTNTGNVALTGISLSDDNDNNDVSCPSTTLAVGANMICSATHIFTQAELDANGSPTPGIGNLVNKVTVSSNEAPDATDVLSIPIVINECKAGTFTFSGNNTLSGTPGNIRPFTMNGVTVRVSGWGRDKTTGAYAPAYVGAYSGGLGVTDLISDKSGSNNQHTADNNGADNYLLFEFDRPVIADQIYLGYVVSDSDVTMWFGNAPDGAPPYILSKIFLDRLITATDFGISLKRWVSINGGNQFGNVLVVAPKIDDSNDYFKVEKLTIICPN